MPPDKRRGAPGGSAPSSKNIAGDHCDGSDNTLSIDLAQLRPSQIGPGELASLRAMWWRQASTGHRLPAERGVIVIMGR